MRVDIRPQWKRLTTWYWDSLEGKETFNLGMSIWEMLDNEYGARKAFNIDAINTDRKMWVVFPDDQSYTAFLLRWA